MSNWAQKGHFSPELREERRKGNAEAKKNVEVQKALLADKEGIQACVRQVNDLYFKVVYFVDGAEHQVKDSTGNTKLFRTFAGAKKWCEEKYFFTFA